LKYTRVFGRSTNVVIFSNFLPLQSNSAWVKPCRFRKLHPFDSRSPANQNMFAGCSLLPSFSSACCATVSSRDDGLKPKSWCCGINSTSCSSALFVWLYRGYPRILDAITILRPETIVRWHRKGFAAFWRWKSRPLGGRPQIDKEVRDLIRRMSFENPLWGAPHIHGELLKLGFDVAQSTVSKYMALRRGRPSQTWKTFLRNHADGIASIDLFVVPTIAFEQLFAFLVLGHGRRQLVWFAVTRHPTAEWLAR
jgi:hypothetical protein